MEAEGTRLVDGRKVLLREMERAITPFGGMVVFLEFLNKIGFVQNVMECMPSWRLGRETVRLLVKDEPCVVKIRMGRRKSMTRYSVPESVARRVHTRLFNPRG
jgi:ubiquinone/menaquinone biosynthesis C-methylase UbiE